MKHLIIQITPVIFLLFSGPSMADDVNGITLASLTNKLAASQVHKFTSRVTLVSACSISCDGANYSNSCSGNESCDCSCTRTPVCECR
jgi:hypothetical protein